MTAEDVDAYFERVGFTGTPRADLETLAALQRLHVASISFENLDPLLGRPVTLTPDALLEKLVRHRRGGYCFEQNMLFEAVLRALGFTVRGLLGRAGLTDTPAGRTHMVLLVTLGELPYLVDVGYGGLVPSGPLRIEPGLVQHTPHEDFRLLLHEDGYRLEVDLRGVWRRLYEFDLRRQLHADYEVANWYTSTHPQALFTRELVAARSAPGLRISLHQRTLTTHRPGEPPEVLELSSWPELRRTLDETLHLDVTGLDLAPRVFG